jgi:hypothetical protein
MTEIVGDTAKAAAKVAEARAHYRTLTDAELHERLNQISVTVQRIRFNDSREAYYHAKRWASEQNKPIRQELAQRQRRAVSSLLSVDGGGTRGEPAPALDFDGESQTDMEDYHEQTGHPWPVGA